MAMFDGIGNPLTRDGSPNFARSLCEKLAKKLRGWSKHGQRATPSVQVKKK